MYESLEKIYYKDPQNYQKIYEERLNSPQTKKIDFVVGNNEAFFVENTDVTDLMIKILKNDKQISLLCRNLPDIALLQYSRKCLIDEIVLTNGIEGVRSSRKEINEALEILEKQSEEKGNRKRFMGLVNKYLKLSQKELIPLDSCQDIRNIYNEIVLAEVVSENKKNNPDGVFFRKDMAEIMSPTGKVIHKGLYPENKIINAMNLSLSFLNGSSMNELYLSCIFHYMLEYIHPFYDGNGRLGRFIFSYCISKELEPLLAYRISETISENIKEYYDAFVTCNHRNNMGDLTPFVIMMLTMIYRSSEELIGTLSEKQTYYLKAKNVLSSLDECRNDDIFDLYGVLTQIALFGESGLTNEHLLKMFNVSFNTLSSRLNIIRKRDLLYEQRIGRRKAYSINLQQLDKMINETIY